MIINPLQNTVLVIEEVAKHCGVSARLIVDHNFGAVGTILPMLTTERDAERGLCSVNEARRRRLIDVGMGGGNGRC